MLLIKHVGYTLVSTRFLIHIQKKDQFRLIDAFQVDVESTAYGGELVADVLKV